MSKLARALILAATLAAVNLAGMTAVAQAQPSDAAQQKLAERWNTDYYQATRMSPTEHKAWLQAHKHFRGATQAQAPAPPRPARSTGQPDRLVAALAVTAVVAGLAMVAARRATRRARVGQAT
jgi:hypothetical protein